MDTTIHKGVSEAYRKNVETILGDRAPEYFKLLEKLTALASKTESKDFDKQIPEFKKLVGEVSCLVNPFGCIFAVMFLNNEEGKPTMRVALIDKLSKEIPQ